MTKAFSRNAIAGLVLLGAIAACGDEGPTPMPPATPTGLAIQQLTLTSVRVTWNTTANATTYTLQRASAADPGVFTDVAASTADTSYDDTGLTAGVAYSYRVSATNTDGTSAFSTAVGVTTGVAAATLTGNITANRTLYADTVYTLSGYVKVASGATLSIEAGTKIVGDSAVAGSSLWILRGAKIEANGTAAAPIVFTSARAEGNRAPGDWGGLIIIGNGIINRTGATILTEGPAGTSENYAGGSNNADNSGFLRYVRVEFAGYDVSNGAGQELNAISSYAVGSGTQYDHVQTMSGLDDSFEFWGGAVQGRYLVSYESGDDHFDWSEGFQGKVQYLVIFQSQRLTPRAGAGTFSSDPRGFEGDGCDPGVSGCTVGATSTSTPYSNPTVVNFTAVGTGPLGGFPADGNGMVMRRGTAGFFANGIVARFAGIGCQIRDEFTDTLRVRDSLNLVNMLFAENAGGNYDDPASATRYCQASKFGADNHQTAAAAASQFVSINPASLDFSPAGQLDTMSTTVAIPAARTSGFFGGTMDATTFVGASDGTKWWQGWTIYAIN